MHTPQTIALLPGLEYGILIVDILVTLFFTFEALLKVRVCYGKVRSLVVFREAGAYWAIDGINLILDF